MKKISLFLIILLFLPMAFASETIDHYCMNIEITDISPTSIKIGEEFTVGILLDNCGKVPEDAVFELMDVSPYIQVKENLIREIPRLGYEDSQRFLVYHMKVEEDASPGIYGFDYKLVFGPEKKFKEEGSFSVDVIGEKADLAIASLKTRPILPKSGDTVELTLRIENTGEGTAKSVEVYMDHSFKGIKQSFIGALNPDEDGPAVLTFIVEEAGEFEFPVIVSYKDDFGNGEIKTMVNLNVMEDESPIGVIALSLVIVIILVAGTYSFFKMKKSKDKVIRQLLKGNNEKKSK